MTYRDAQGRPELVAQPYVKTGTADARVTEPPVTAKTPDGAADAGSNPEEVDR